jgi:hypothetical protein
MALRFYRRPLTVKLSGRAKASRAHWSIFALQAHKAPSLTTFHGPLERLLEGLVLPSNEDTRASWHCLTARQRAAPTSSEESGTTKPPSRMLALPQRRNPTNSASVIAPR